MGGLFSTPTVSAAPKLDITQGTFSGDYLSKFSASAAEGVKKTTESLQWFGWRYFVFKVIAFGLLILALVFAWDAIAIRAGWPRTGILPAPTVSGPPAVAPSSVLLIQTAMYGPVTPDPNVPPVDVAAVMRGKVSNNILPSFTVGAAALGLAKEPAVASVNQLIVTYTVGYQTTPTSITTAQGSVFPQLPPEHFTNYREGFETQVVEPETLLSRFTRTVTGSNSSGDLLPSSLNAQKSVIIAGNRAPLSAEKEGAYGMQWWMFVKDWNYGYGKTKTIVKRTDPTNTNIMNPAISLHPTDNTMSFVVSLFPTKEGGASVSEPAPAGHIGMSDDVFACEVSNIPLQTWFSVSMTVFGRNLDVYIDGKLVKSCFLPGVPKPAVGDIALAPEGGFSGRICNFYHYPRMITPSDAMTFWSAGKTCPNTADEDVVTSGSGYNVKFGVYDQLGKQVQEYAF